MQVKSEIAQSVPQSGVVASSPGTLLAIPPEWALRILSIEEMMTILTISGWPLELISQALSVSRGESGWIPGNSNGHYMGLFQLDAPFWFNYCGQDYNLWYDPVVNATCAYAVYRYDINRGNEAWAQWEVKP